MSTISSMRRNAPFNRYNQILKHCEITDRFSERCRHVGFKTIFITYPPNLVNIFIICLQLQHRPTCLRGN